MAKVLQLYDETAAIDLLAGNIVLEEAGLSLRSADKKIWETIGLVSGATDANIRTTKAQIDDYIERAKLYIDNPVEAKGIWLYVQSEGESAKRALIYDGSTDLVSSSVFNTPLLGRDSAIFRIALLRHPYWENPSGSAVNVNGLSAWGGKGNLGTLTGTTYGRIQRALFTSSTAARLGKFWIGIRPSRHGTAQFTTVWEAEAGTPHSPDTSVVADGTASGGSKMQTTFASVSTMYNRFEVRLSNVVGSNFSHNIGRYLVLMRCKVSSGTTQVLVRLASGWDRFTTHTEQIIDGKTSWNLVEMGEIQIPPTGNRDGVMTTDDALGYFGLLLSAERLSASGTLDVDGFVLVPSEHIITGDGADVYSGNSGQLDYYTAPLYPFSEKGDDQYAIFRNPAPVNGIQFVDYTFTNWQYPIIGGTLVVAAEPWNAGHDLTATVNASLTVYPRWKSYRTS
jgi:hypothetical protein